MSKRSSHSKSSNQVGSMKEQKTQSGSKRINNSKRSLLLAPTQQYSQKSQRSQKTQVTQKTIAPPDADKFDEIKKFAVATRRSQITQIADGKSMIKREDEFDKTQWELTKWADEAAKPTDIEKPVDVLTNDVAPKPLGLAPPSNVKTSEIPGENRQEEGEKGDYLLELPIVSLILNGIEIFFGLLALLLSNIASGMAIFGVYMTTINLILCLIGVGFITFWQWKHNDVAEEVSKQGTKHYYVRGCSKKMYFHIHYWRIILYFLTFVILLYYACCTDEKVGYRTHGFCRKSGAMGLFYTSAIFSFLIMIPAIIHFVHIKLGTFAIVSFCRK